jgi:uncharacterized protein CbrC (UPF0167 family)
MKTKVKCPCCEKKIGYLFDDVSYSEKQEISKKLRFPIGITECPYCKTLLTKEIKQNKIASPNGESANPESP